MQFLKWLGRSGTSNAKRPARPLGMDFLEDRSVPAATLSLVNGLLDVRGTGDDTIKVLRNPATMNIEVEVNGGKIGTFTDDQIARIRITGGPGTNTLGVDTAIHQPAILIGGPGLNTLKGGGGPTKEIAGGGNDTLAGGAGKSILIGGPGNNVITAGAGNTTLVAGKGNDTLNGNVGNDRLYGGPGTSVLNGNGGFNRYFGGTGPTTINPGPNDLPLPPPQQTAPPTFDLNNFVSEAKESVDTLSAAQVDQLLSRAAAASASEDGIIAIVDRTGRILGVRVEAGVDPGLIADPAKLTFAVDGALALARTGAFFGNNGAPLNSRTIQFISQSTILEREVNSSPDVLDPNSPLRGPGFVAPIGTGGHFPPVPDTPSANLFDIEHTNRDREHHAGPDGIAGTADDPVQGAVGRFNIPLADYAPGKALEAPVSFGEETGLFPNGQSRGIGTLPGGLGIYDQNGQLVGGIGVFFPGKTGYASEENSVLSADYDPTKPDRSLEAEWMAFAATGGSPGAGFAVGTINGVAPLQGFGQPFGVITVDGIQVPIFGPLVGGPEALVAAGQTYGLGNPNSQAALPAIAQFVSRDGVVPPNGWIVPPKDAADGSLTAEDVKTIVANAVGQATQTRAAIRLPQNSAAAMVIAVSDNAGNVIGLYRMPDATFFSVDVAVAKSRNVTYYSNPQGVDPLDAIQFTPATGSALPDGTAATNRTFRYLALPNFPEGVSDFGPAPFSVLNDGQADIKTGLNKTAPLPASAFTSVAGHDAFAPGTNFRDPRAAVGNTNGIVFFPGSAPLYKNADRGGVKRLVAGLGISGDGVDQDDVVTVSGAVGYEPNRDITADQYKVSDIRLPYQKFPRNPEARPTDH